MSILKGVYRLQIGGGAEYFYDNEKIVYAPIWKSQSGLLRNSSQVY